MAVNGCKWLGMAKHGCKWLDMAVNGWKMLHMTGWVWLEMTGHGWKWLEMVGDFKRFGISSLCVFLFSLYYLTESCADLLSTCVTFFLIICFPNVYIFNRPGVAGAVLHTAS